MGRHYTREGGNKGARTQQSSEAVAPKPKPSVMEKAVEYDKDAKEALGRRRKEMLEADT